MHTLAAAERIEFTLRMRLLSGLSGFRFEPSTQAPGRIASKVLPTAKAPQYGIRPIVPYASPCLKQYCAYIPHPDKWLIYAVRYITFSVEQLDALLVDNDLFLDLVLYFLDQLNNDSLPLFN
ncbi:uncharacterized protein RSE6_01311 [Rhynchosporium secalis]|uniref:Uncharacterized protein n=1 Tax=Rhynchosporium secalis TaxID=38038 RepID=A0A1E1LXG1_RHYSE|nr:uncharacterized protein RSE6_01311 [Rhynchosporium secalis]